MEWDNHTMARIRLLPFKIDVSLLKGALDAHPELWDEHTARTKSEDSPHHGLSDIWVRFAPAGSGADMDHRSIWYPAADSLPVRQMVHPIMAEVWGEELGGILITRIPPGATCRPHKDLGWHAKFYEKFAVQVAAAPGQAFHFESESLVTKPGDVYWFDNKHTHWVTNESDSERITMIACIKTDVMNGIKE